MIAAIVCVDQNFAIGNKGDLLVNIPEDMKQFKKITKGGTVLVGSKTYESLPQKPLSNRTNIIITRKCKKKPKIFPDGTFQSKCESLSYCYNFNLFINQHYSVIIA